MCRLALKTANEPFSPYTVLTAMEAMQEGYDGSGLGLLLRGMEFEDFRYNPKFPILSGIAHSDKAWRRLDDFMEERGYELKYDHKFHMRWDLVTEKNRYRYFLRAYRMPDKFMEKSQQEKDDELMLARLALRRDGEANGNDLTVFSFWPDVAMIKEIGWPLAVGDALCLHDGQIKSRVCMAQGRQNTNYGINLYACHPFFLQ
ncbi:MAG: glutamate synthase, partial [Desulfobulbaceae bacterium]